MNAGIRLLTKCRTQVSKASVLQFQFTSVVLLLHSFMSQGMLSAARWKLDVCNSQLGLCYKGGPLKFTYTET